MRIMLFAIRDQKSNGYHRIWQERSQAAAIRGFGDAVNGGDENNQFRSHPEDYALWHVGEWDDDTGEVTGVQPTQIALASDLVRG